MPANYISYLRVSTDKQGDSGAGLEAQRHAIKGYIERVGGKLVGEYDDVESGKRADNRPGLQAALTDACNLKATLISYSLSRWARSIKDAMDIADKLDKAGAGLASVTEAIDTSTTNGKMMYRMMALFAQFERELTSERMKAWNAMRRAKGLRLGNSASLRGHRSPAAEQNRIAAVTSAERMRPIVAALGGGAVAAKDLAAVLNSKGYRTDRGCRWHTTTAARLLARLYPRQTAACAPVPVADTVQSGALAPL